MNNENTTNRQFSSVLLSSIDIFIAVRDIQDVIFFAVILQKIKTKNDLDENKWHLSIDLGNTHIIQ